jgi:hypothetical protein
MATLADIVGLSFGYLTTEDLLKWCPAQLLVKAYTEDTNSLQSACDRSISRVTSQLSTRYDLTTELVKSGSARQLFLVDILSIFAIRNVVGSAQSVSEKMLNDFAMADKDVADIRNGENNLQVTLANTAIASISYLALSNFSTLD